MPLGDSIPCYSPYEDEQVDYSLEVGVKETIQQLSCQSFARDSHYDRAQAAPKHDTIAHPYYRFTNYTSFASSASAVSVYIAFQTPFQRQSAFPSADQLPLWRRQTQPFHSVPRRLANRGAVHDPGFPDTPSYLVVV